MPFSLRRLLAHRLLLFSVAENGNTQIVEGRRLLLKQAHNGRQWSTSGEPDYAFLLFLGYIVFLPLPLFFILLLPFDLMCGSGGRVRRPLITGLAYDTLYSMF